MHVFGGYLVSREALVNFAKHHEIYPENEQLVLHYVNRWIRRHSIHSVLFNTTAKKDSRHICLFYHLSTIGANRRINFKFEEEPEDRAMKDALLAAGGFREEDLVWTTIVDPNMGLEAV